MRRLHVPGHWIIGAVALLCYVNSLGNGYVYDSIEIVERNPLVHEPGRWLDAWKVDHWYQEASRTANRDLLYRPAALLSYRLVAAVAGPGPLPQHLINILLHAVNGLLVFALAVRMSGSSAAVFQQTRPGRAGDPVAARPRAGRAWAHDQSPDPSATGGGRYFVGIAAPTSAAKAAQTGALVAGLLFAVLPIHTEVVNDIVGRTDLLATAGVLTALLTYRRFLQSDRKIPAAVWFAATALAAFVSMSAKESGLAVVILIPLFDWYCRRGARRDSRTSERRGGARRDSRTSTGGDSRTSAGGKSRTSTGGDSRTGGDPEPRASARAASRDSSSPPPTTTLRPILPAARIRHFLYPLACMAIPAAAYLALRYHALGGRFFQEAAATKTINVLVDAPAWQRALGVVQAWGMYWQKTFWPAILCPDYSINAIRLATSLLDPDVLFGIAVLIVLVIAAVIAWRQGNRAILLAVIALVVSYAPASNAIVLMQAFFAERIWYLPSVWVSLLFAVAIAPLLHGRLQTSPADPSREHQGPGDRPRAGAWGSDKDGHLAHDHPDKQVRADAENQYRDRKGAARAAQQQRTAAQRDSSVSSQAAPTAQQRREYLPGQSQRSVAWIAFAMLIVAMAVRCWIRNPEWRSNRTLAAAAHRDHPDSIATLVMHGGLLARAGRLDEAIPLLQRAVRIDPGFTVAHRALARAYQTAGRYEAALEHWRIAEMQFPGHPESSAALGSLAARMREAAQKELTTLKDAADVAPHDLKAELAYVRKLLDLGRHDEAVSRFESAGPRFAEQVNWHREYAVALLYAGRSNEAIEQYRQGTNLKPIEPDPYVELAALLLERQEDGDLTEAERLVARALALAPADLNTRVLQAELHALTGRLDDARRIYREVLASTPDDSPHRALWESRARLLGVQDP